MAETNENVKGGPANHAAHTDLDSPTPPGGPQRSDAPTADAEPSDTPDPTRDPVSDDQPEASVPGPGEANSPPETTTDEARTPSEEERREQRENAETSLDQPSS